MKLDPCTKRKIENHFFKLNKHITKNFIKSISPKLLSYCEHKANLKPYCLSNASSRWSAVLHRVMYGLPRCATCGTTQVKFRNFRDGYTKHCSSKCAGLNAQTDIKRKTTNIQTWGVERPQQHLQEIRDKFKNTMVERYGAPYSVFVPSIRRKIHKTNLKRYGNKYSISSAYARSKSKETMLARYGVEHSMQIPTVFEKQQINGFKAQSIKVNGKEFRVRGYEDYAILWFVKQGVSVKHIINSTKEGMPNFKWKDKFGKTHVYFPDMKVKYKNKWHIVEVKSTFSLGIINTPSAKKSGKYSLVKRKAKAVLSSGKRFLLLLINNSGYVAPLYDIETKTRKEIIQELKHSHPRKFRQL